MIRCSICQKFAKPHKLITKWINGDVVEFKVKCKKHGIVKGEYDDYEELQRNFDMDGEDRTVIMKFE
jgi:uncharacterized protein YacL (UPF0231 family)